MSKKVAVIMGSDSDWPVVKGACTQLEEFGIPFEAHILSAHRTPAAAAEFARSARANGFGVLICAAGMAAHLAGAFAGNSTLPVIGIPMKGGAMDGLDALLATVQMPSGIPVATVAINGAKNAAVLAAQILAVSDDELAAKLDAAREKMADQIAQKGRNFRPSWPDPRVPAHLQDPLFNISFETTSGRKDFIMNKLEQLYEGKAKKVYSTEDPNVVIVSYKDDATAFDGLKKGTITGKGAINNQMTNFLMQQLEKAGVPTHFVEELSERETAVKKVSIVPLEVIIRNISAGSFAKRYGVEEGIVFDEPTIEFSYKNDDLHDPLINDYHAVALKLATWDEIDTIKKYAFQVNDFLKKTLAECGVTLVDFKLEFGKTADGTIVLADEISPDTCRFWDSKTGEKLDKDRFRRDLGNVEGAYQEMARRLLGK